MFPIGIIPQIVCCLVAMGPNLLLGSLGSSLGCLFTLKNIKGLLRTLCNYDLTGTGWERTNAFNYPNFPLLIISNSQFHSVYIGIC